MTSAPPVPAGIVFDFDGTLTHPAALDFAAIRQAIKCPDGVDILTFLAGIADSEERQRAEAILLEFELEAAGRSRPNPGAEELLYELRDRQIPMAILTRNVRAAVDLAMHRFSGITLDDFAAVVTRECHYPPKPDPAGLLAAIKAFRLPKDTSMQLVWMVGDYVYDIKTGKRAGTTTILLCQHSLLPDYADLADYRIRALDQVLPWIG